RRHRILEDHRDVVPTDLAQAPVVHRQQVLAVEQRLAARDRGPARVQAHDRQAGDALAAAGLADDAERLALLDLEADAVDRLDDAVVGAEIRAEIVDLEQGHAQLRPQASLMRGSITAYRRSTIRLMTMIAGV